MLDLENAVPKALASLMGQALGSRKSAQALGAPRKFLKVLITNKVTTNFKNSLCTSISCTSFSCLYARFTGATAFSRLKQPPFVRTRSIGTVVLLIVITLCSFPSFADEHEDIDPWQNVNRKVFAFNNALDKYLLKPVARVYQFVTPQFVDNGVTNIFSNLGEVVSFVNNILQFKPRAMLASSSRLVVNSTVGLVGIFDIAEKIGLEKNPEDFGQTFAKWGMPSGPYVVLPVFGSRTLRSSVGLVPDTMIYPSSFLDHMATRNTMTALDIIDNRADLIKAEEVIFGDRYTFLRDVYLQNREFLINDGEVEDDFGNEEFEDF